MKKKQAAPKHGAPVGSIKPNSWEGYDKSHVNHKGGLKRGPGVDPSAGAQAKDGFDDHMADPTAGVKPLGVAIPPSAIPQPPDGE